MLPAVTDLLQYVFGADIKWLSSSPVCLQPPGRPSPSLASLSSLPPLHPVLPGPLSSVGSPLRSAHTEGHGTQMQTRRETKIIRTETGSSAWRKYKKDTTRTELNLTSKFYRRAQGHRDGFYEHFMK